MKDIQLDSFSNFWLLLNQELILTDCSNYFKNNSQLNSPLLNSFEFLQPKINPQFSVINQLDKKILHFKNNQTQVPFRGTIHTYKDLYFILAWPFINSIKEITRLKLGSLLEHPSCIITDFLILKDVLSKQQEKIKKLELEHIEKLLLEQQKINQHQSKLATIGEIASGVGHEISNPLTIASLNNAMMLKKINDGSITIEEIKARLEKQTLVYERMAKIVNGLKTFSRVDEEDDSPFSLQKEVQKTVDMVFEIYKNKGITISTDFDPEDVLVIGSKGLFGQVVMNFLSNSRDALQNVEKKTIHIQIHRMQKEKVQFLFSDTGEGISEKNMKNILRPFFTTKASGEGTGIGMTIVQNFVYKANAELLVDSTPGVGTTFTIVMNIHHPENPPTP
jgi:signal transduction histidine kinase